MQVAECNTNRLKMMAEAADSSMAVKVLVVKVPHPILHCVAVLYIHRPLAHAHCAAQFMQSPLNDATVLTQPLRHLRCSITN